MAKTYNSYKDSGIAWIGEIPSEWKVSRYKFYTTNRMGETILASDTTDVGIPIYSATQDDSIFGYIQNPKVILKKGDIVIPARGNSIGYATQIKDEIATCSQTTICSTNIHGINSRFLFYCIYGLKDDWFRYDGSAIPQITVDQVKNNVLPLPSKQEQHSIASFLDTKCGEIDSLISLQEEMISELQAYKQSVITEAVTKGLDPNAKMKDSGVEWIGEIPEGWNLSRAKFLVEITHGTDPRTDGDIPVYGSGAGSFKTCGEYKEGDAVLIGRKGATLNIPHYIVGKYWNVDTAFDVKAKNCFSLRYYYYLAFCFDYKKYMSQTTLPGMTQSDYNNMTLPFPPLNIQKSIATYLDSKTSQIDSLISLKQQKIDELKDYKKSIIYEYVTGKKRV